MLDVLLLDLMGTVIYDPYREALEAAIGMDIATAAPLRDPQSWPDFECGVIDEAEFVRRFFVSDNGHQFDMDAFHQVRREGYHFLPGMRELLVSLDGVVGRYVASNYPVWIEEMGRTFEFDTLFEGVYASCHLGVRKPDPKFFSAILDDLGVQAQDCLFVDDRRANCEAAAELGMQVHLFDGTEALRARLERDGVLTA